MNPILIDLFGCAVREEPLLDFSQVNAIAVRCGFIVAPEACTSSVLNYLNSQQVNPNSTFYRTWQDVTAKSRYELFLDQVRHYMTTYGSDFTLGNGYVPNAEADVVPYGKYKILTAVEVPEMLDKCLSLLTSGIALKSDAVAACVDFVAENVKAVDIDVDAVKNREAQVLLCQKLGITPHDKFALLRYIVYVTTGETMIIKNEELVDKIHLSQSVFDFSTLSESQLRDLSSIFLRYKPVFLAFKHSLQLAAHRGRDVLKVTANAKYINRLRRLAKKYHQPLPMQFWARVMSDQPSVDDVKERLKELSSFRIVALMQLCRERMLEAQSGDNLSRLFIIRNQKLHIRDYEHLDVNEQYLKSLYDILEQDLIRRLSAKACPVVLPENYTLTLPATQKSFMGTMPFGTSYQLGENNYIGIYWRSEWGTDDFDLSVVDAQGRKIGWNSDYVSQAQDGEFDIVFSGDMTNAEPEASEVLYIRRGVIDGMIYVNRYDGDAGSRYKLYFGQQQIPMLTQNFMVDPDSILLQVDMSSDYREEQSVGLIMNNTVTLMRFTTGGGMVSDDDPELLACMRRKAQSFISLEDILVKAGFTILHEAVEGDNVLDFTKPDTSTLISLLS